MFFSILNSDIIIVKNQCAAAGQHLMYPNVLTAAAPDQRLIHPRVLAAAAPDRRIIPAAGTGLWSDPLVRSGLWPIRYALRTVAGSAKQMTGKTASLSYRMNRHRKEKLL